MSTIAAKKPPVTGRDPSSTTSTSSSSTSRATPRSSTPNGSAPADRPSGGSHARTRSFRTGAPVSARQAAGERRKSLLPPGANGSNTNVSSLEEEEVVRAENIAALDDLRERLSKAELSSEEYRKQAEVLQSRFDDVTKDQVKYEEKCHELEEQAEALQNDKREATRKIREMEAIYEAERSSIVKEKEEMANKEEELQMVIARLKDSLNQQKMVIDDDSRSSRSGTCLIDRMVLVVGQSLSRHQKLTIVCSPSLSISRRRQLCATCFPPTQRLPQRLSQPVQVDLTEG